MSNYNKLTGNLEKLGLSTFKDNLGQSIDAVNSREISYVDSLLALTDAEIRFRKERAEHSCITVANFPFIKGFDDFDFSFQPCVNEGRIRGFSDFRFIGQKENIIFLGTSGVGKTHLATSIGIECAKERYSIYFTTCNDLLASLKKAHMENRLHQRLRHYSKYRVLIIDEIGYLPIDPNSANMFFQLVNMRYEKNSTIITTNKPFGEWGEVFGDPTIANAILDRLLHHSHIIKITGRSYRTRNTISSNDVEQEKQ